jgi:uroporphyrinogen-III synthase
MGEVGASRIDLRGARIALLEGRMSGELADLVRRHGGDPVSAPALREDPIPSGDAVARFIDELRDGRVQFVILLTGAGVSALVREADALGRLPELVDGLERATTICRGPKPAGALAKLPVTVDVRVPSPHTTADVIDAVSKLDIDGQGVALVHYGERSTPLTDALRPRASHIEELCLYEWQLPHDVEPLRALIRDVIAGRIDAVAFTSQIQVRHLLRVADEIGRRDMLLHAFTHGPIIAAIGPTCAEALVAAGITPHVVPDPPKMGPLLSALAARLAGRDPGSDPARDLTSHTPRGPLGS